MPLENNKCVCCPNDAIESHHLWPTHLGGPIDGPQVWLCSNCHRWIHRIASRLYNGKPIGDYSEPWLRRASPIINRIVRALREFEGATLADLSEILSRIIIQVPKDELRQIHLRKMDLGYSSLERYILALIRNDLPRW